MNIHASQKSEAIASFKAIGILAGILLLVWLAPPPDTAGIAGYLVLHNLMEIAAISVAAMVFAIGWNTNPHRQSGNVLILACIFLGVTLLDFSHTMSFQGMPDYVTPGTPEKKH